MLQAGTEIVVAGIDGQDRGDPEQENPDLGGVGQYLVASRSGQQEGKSQHLSPVWARAHGEYHSSLAAACDNAWLLRMRATLYEQTERYRRLSLPLGTEPRDVPTEHKAIFDAAIARDADRACAALEEHLRLTAAILKASSSL